MGATVVCWVVFDCKTARYHGINIIEFISTYNIYYYLCENLLYTFMSSLSLSLSRLYISALVWQDLLSIASYTTLDLFATFGILWLSCGVTLRAAVGFLQRFGAAPLIFAMPKFQFGARKLWDEISGLSGIEESENRSWNSLKDGWDMMRWVWALFLHGIFIRPRSLHESRLELGGKWEDFVGRLKLISKMAHAYCHWSWYMQLSNTEQNHVASHSCVLETSTKFQDFKSWEMHGHNSWGEDEIILKVGFPTASQRLPNWVLHGSLADKAFMTDKKGAEFRSRGQERSNWWKIWKVGREGFGLSNIWESLQDGERFGVSTRFLITSYFEHFESSLPRKKQKASCSCYLDLYWDVAQNLNKGCCFYCVPAVFPIKRLW